MLDHRPLKHWRSEEPEAAPFHHRQSIIEWERRKGNHRRREKKVSTRTSAKQSMRDYRLQRRRRRTKHPANAATAGAGEKRMRYSPPPPARLILLDHYRHNPTDEQSRAAPRNDRTINRPSARRRAEWEERRPLTAAVNSDEWKRSDPSASEEFQQLMASSDEVRVRAEGF